MDSCILMVPLQRNDFLTTALTQNQEKGLFPSTLIPISSVKKRVWSSAKCGVQTQSRAWSICFGGSNRYQVTGVKSQSTLTDEWVIVPLFPLYNAEFPWKGKLPSEHWRKRQKKSHAIYIWECNLSVALLLVNTVCFSISLLYNSAPAHLSWHSICFVNVTVKGVLCAPVGKAQHC